MNLNDTGIFFRAIRKSRNLSIKEVAEIACLSPSTVSCIENGEPCNTHSLDRLAWALGYRIELAVFEDKRR